MNWLNVNIGLSREEFFMIASNEHAGIWFRLMVYCTEQENGGIISKCSKWAESTWQRAAGLSVTDVTQESSLWEWKNGALFVHGYNHKHEHAVQQKRKAASITNQARWNDKIQGKNRSATRSASRSASRSLDRKERKKERNNAPERNVILHDSHNFEPVITSNGTEH